MSFFLVFANFVYVSSLWLRAVSMCYLRSPREQELQRNARVSCSQRNPAAHSRHQ